MGLIATDPRTYHTGGGYMAGTLLSVIGHAVVDVIVVIITKK